MRTPVRSTRARRAARWALAVLLLLSSGVSAIPTAAAPSAAEVAAAKKRLEELNQQLILYAEQYNQARIALKKVQQRLVDTRLARKEAVSEASSAAKALQENASRAYQSVGSQFASLFEATSLNDFADRLEFIGNIAQADLDLATRATAAQERAAWTAEQLVQAIAERRNVVEQIAEKKRALGQGVAEARRLYVTLNAQFQDAVKSGSYNTPPPPVDSGEVQAVLNAAFSVRGTRYIWGAASPSYGFDCSGLTMWAWAHAGVSLPHSSQAQYAVLPHVSREDLRPGDLLFFYTPISHVGMYLSATTMIDANHPGDVVNVRPIHWEYFVGAARP